MSDYPMLISNKLHSFRNFLLQKYKKNASRASAVYPAHLVNGKHQHTWPLRQGVSLPPCEPPSNCVLTQEKFRRHAAAIAY